jgi:hypothetical protein
MFGRIRRQHPRCGADAEAFASSALGHSQALLAPEPLDLLVVDDPALGTGIVVGGAKPAARMVFRVPAKPAPQAGIGVGRGRRRGLASLGDSVLPGHPAGEQLRYTHRTDEVMHGRPPAFRA